MSSPPPLQQNPPNPRKRPSISSTASQQGIKRPRMHPLRQTSFPASIDTDPRAFSATSDAGSVTGSFTGSLGGASAATGEGVFAGAKLKKRGRKSKAEKEREREDAMSARAGTVDGTRTGSIDADGSSVRAGGGAGGDDADEDEDFDDEGELLGGEEGPTDTEAEKKNLAYVLECFSPSSHRPNPCLHDFSGFLSMPSIRSNLLVTIYSNVRSYERKPFVESSTMRSLNLFLLVS